ncbi:MAG: lipoyl synthase [Pseudomonadota bacterium]
MKKPQWIRIRPPQEHCLHDMKGLLDEFNLNTVCESALCPNIGSCFAEGTATFMILGEICTRNCSFCSVKNGNPSLPDPLEPERVAKAVQKLKLEHVVVTSVTRDDLPDGGASLFAETVRQIKRLMPETSTEVLIPDFGGVKENVEIVFEAEPEILGHNIETVPRMYVTIRPQAHYHRSLSILQYARQINPRIVTKSGMMVGLGETREEILEIMQDLREVDCDILTIGQYLRPTPQNVEVKEYIHPEVFEEYKEEGYSRGFKYVASSPFVRSSFHAKRTWEYIRKRLTV